MYLDRIKAQVLAEKQCAIAFTSILIWDWLALLPAEIKYIWRNNSCRKVTPLRIIYPANRYGSLLLQSASLALVVSNVSKEVCSRLYWVETAGLIYIVFISDVLLAARVAALYENTRTIIAGLFTLLSVQLAFMVAVGAQLRPVDVPAPIAEYIGLNGCLTGDYRGSHQGFAYMMSVAPFVTNLVLLALIVHRSWSISKELGGVRIAILRRFVRDGVMYFAIISAFNIMNVAFWTQSSPALKTFGVPALVVISSTLSCRLALSLHTSKPTATNFDSLAPQIQPRTFPPTASANGTAVGPPRFKLAASSMILSDESRPVLVVPTLAGAAGRQDSGSSSTTNGRDEEKEIEGK